MALESARSNFQTHITLHPENLAKMDDGAFVALSYGDPNGDGHDGDDGDGKGKSPERGNGEYGQDDYDDTTP